MAVKDLTSAQTLRDRAGSFDDLIVRVARDEQGIVCANCCLEPLRALQAEDIGFAPSLVADVDPGHFYAYEDAGMATGAYLAAQCARYRVTGDPSARRYADEAFEAVRYIYQLGVNQGRSGYFPKPYGARYSEQFSRDQYLFVMRGISEYLTLADRRRRDAAIEMLARMAEFWVSIDYESSYFGLPPASHLDDYLGSLFLGIIGIAAHAVGASHLNDEYERLHHVVQLGPRMPQTLLAKFRSGETYDAATYFRQAENPIMLKAMAIDALWDIKPSYADLWRRSLQRFRDEDLTVGLDLETGLNYFIVGYDSEKDRTFLTSPGVIGEIDNPLGLAVLSWGGLRQSAGSTQTAYSAAIIADRLQSDPVRDLMHLILGKLDLESFRGLTAPGAEHLPPDHEFEAGLLNTGYIAYWLWTYWLARERRLLAE